MSSLPHTLLFFLIALTVLIAVHESGHFWVARRLGVKVLRFSLGFGRVIWRHQKSADETEFTVSLLPLGGYVRMVDEREGAIAEAHRPFAFNRKPVWARAAIVVAGPLFNLMLAILIYWIVFMWGETGTPPILGAPLPATVAADAGFREGDRIQKVNDRLTPTFALAMGAILEAAMEEESIRTELTSAAGEARQLTFTVPHALILKPEHLFEALGFKAQEVALPPVVDQVEPGSAAEQAGLLAGDRLVKADERPVKDWREWAEYVRSRPGQVILLKLDRDGVAVTLQITPAAIPLDAASSGGDQKPSEAAPGTPSSSLPETIGRVGARVRLPQEAQVVYRLGPVDALMAAFERTLDYSLATVRMAGRMLVGRAAVENLSGPISIAQLAGRSATLGMDQFLKFLALVSISLGVLNLLPIPVLDGGHLLFLALEAIRGRPLAEATELRFQQIGMLILMSLMLLGVYLDLGRL